MNTANCKEELIETTIALINENHGDVSKATIRDITKRSGVSVGLIHYHFGSKEHLITTCVQRIISKVVRDFKPDLKAGEHLPRFEASKCRLIKAASEIFDFFYAYPAISRISILNDNDNLTSKTSTFFSIEGFSSIIGDGIKDEGLKARISFSLTVTMQTTFLKTLESSSFMGYDFSKKEERDRYIFDLVNMFMRSEL